MRKGLALKRTAIFILTAILVAAGAYYFQIRSAEDSALHLLNDLPTDVEFVLGEQRLKLRPGESQFLSGLARGEIALELRDPSGALIEKSVVELLGPDHVQVFSALGVSPLVIRSIDVAADGTRSYTNEKMMQHGRSLLRFSELDFVLPTPESLEGLSSGRYRILDRAEGGWVTALGQQLSQRHSKDVAAVARKIADLPGLGFETALKTLEFVKFAESPVLASQFGFRLAGMFPDESEFRRLVFGQRQQHDDRQAVIAEYRARSLEHLDDALASEFLILATGPRDCAEELAAALDRHPNSKALLFLGGLAAHFAGDFRDSDRYLARCRKLDPESAATAAELRFRNGVRVGKPRGAAGAFVDVLKKTRSGEFGRLFVLWERVREDTGFPPGLSDLKALLTVFLGNPPSNDLYRTLRAAARPHEFTAGDAIALESASMEQTLQLRLALESGPNEAEKIENAKEAVLAAGEQTLANLDDEARVFALGILLAQERPDRAASLAGTLDAETQRVLIPYLLGTPGVEIDNSWLLPERRALARYLRATLFMTALHEKEPRRVLRERALEDDLLSGFAARMMAP